MDTKVKVQELDCTTHQLLLDIFKGSPGFARFGEAGYLLPANYKEDADNFKSMVVRPDDVWVITSPRSGTTLTQELVWLLQNNLDYEKASKSHLSERYAFLGHRQLGNVDKLEEMVTKQSIRYIIPSKTLETMPSPRFIKSHFPLSLLPDNLLDTAKVVYVARDSRDVAVSRYHLSKLMKIYVGNFKSYWNFFINDLGTYTPYFQHVKEAWASRHHPNMHFMFYEDLIMDMPATIKRVADFLGKEVTEEQIVKLCEHLNINNFRKNDSVNMSWLPRVFGKPDNENFIRQGGAGGWRIYFDEEMSAQAQEWMRAHLAGTDLSFPDDS